MHPSLMNQLSVQHQNNLRGEAKATHGCLIEFPVRPLDERPEPAARTVGGR
jgi:hypothetical protein